MALNESSLPDQAVIADEPVAPSALLTDLREAVSTVLAIEREAELSQRDQYAITFEGTLQLESEEALARLEALLTPLGFTPFLQREQGRDLVAAVQGLLDPNAATRPDADNLSRRGCLGSLVRVSGRSPLWLHGGLLIATIASTIYAASFLLNGRVDSLGKAIAAGGPFAIALLFILGVHETSHYLAARRHRVKVTLPFFIPLPVPGSLGTLGAVILVRSALKTRRALFDVGVSGPLAGLVVALPVFVIGLLLPPIPFGAPINLVFRGVAVPPLLDFIGSFVVEGSLSRAILTHPVALAAWFGILLTALNLLPLGQFDGGHVAYALFGRYAWGIALVTFFALIFGGLFLWPTWFLWAILAGFSGLRHPLPQNDIMPLGLRRRLLGWVTILLFFLIVMPQPITTRQGLNLLPDQSAPAAIPTLAPLNIPTPRPFDPGASAVQSGN